MCIWTYVQTFLGQTFSRFKSLDGDGKGYITINDLRRHFKVSFT